MTLPDYEGYEQLGAFTGPELLAYREMLLSKTKEQTNFIDRHIVSKLQRPIDVVEIGSGNGRLLIDLANHGLLEWGTGLELSSSRIEFAKQWAKDLNIHDIVFEQTDTLNITTWIDADLAVCITGTFQYLYPHAPEAPMKMLKFMRRSANYALFELYKKPTMGRTWHELTPQDKWRFILDEYTDTGDWVEHNKTFVAKDGSVDVRTEHLAYYTLQAFLRHVRKAGFETVHVANENASSMVILVS